MTIPPNEVDKLLNPSADTESLYLSVRTVVGGLLRRECGMSEAAVEGVLHTAMNGYQAIREKVLYPMSWLVDMVFSEADTYLRLRGDGGYPQDGASRMRDILYTRAALETLPQNARDVVRMRFDEQKSFEAIAVELGITARYARHLYSKAMAMLEKWQQQREAQE